MDTKKVWAEKNTVCIQVNPYFTYYAKIRGIGTFNDSPALPTMWGWIHHLKEKVWWDKELQASFIDLATLMDEQGAYKNG